MPAPGTYVLEDDGSGGRAGCVVFVYSDLTANDQIEFLWTHRSDRLRPPFPLSS